MSFIPRRLARRADWPATHRLVWSRVALLLLVVIGLVISAGSTQRSSSPTSGTPAAPIQSARPTGDYYDWLGSGARTSHSPSTGPRGEPVLRWRGKVIWPPEEMAVSRGIVAESHHSAESFTGYDLASGFPIWTRPRGGGSREHLFAGPDGFYLAGGTRLIALNPATGQQRWRYGNDGIAVAHVIADAPNGPLALAKTETGFDLIWLDESTGVERRRITLPTEVVMAGSGNTVGHSAVVSYGPSLEAIALGRSSVFVTDRAGGIGAVDAQSGRLRWRVETGHRLSFPPAVAGDLVLATARGSDRSDGSCDVFVENEPGRILALDAATGTIRWNKTLTGRVPPPTVADGLVLVVQGAELIALDLFTGATRWSVREPDQIGWVPIVADDSVYLTTDGGRAIALDLVSGQQRWSLDTGRDMMVPLAVAAGTLLLGPAEHRAIWIAGGAPAPLIAIGGSESPPVGAATPIADSDVSGLPPCLLPEPSSAASAPAPAHNRVFASDLVRSEDVPRGKSAPPEVVAAITSTLEMARRCNRPGFDDRLRGVIPARTWPVTHGSGPFAWFPPATGSPVAPEVWVLSDGRVLAVPYSVGLGMAASAAIPDWTNVIVFERYDARSARCMRQCPEPLADVIVYEQHRGRWLAVEAVTVRQVSAWCP